MGFVLSTRRKINNQSTGRGSFFPLNELNVRFVVGLRGRHGKTMLTHAHADVHKERACWLPCTVSFRTSHLSEHPVL